jgi:hypothetical protein
LLLLCRVQTLTVAMPGRVTRQSSMLSLETEADDEDESSDEDESFAEKLARLEKEKEEARRDASFFFDGDGDDDDEVESTDEYSDEGEPAAAGEDQGEAPAPAESARNKRVAAGRKSVAQRCKMALKKRVGETNKGDPPEFDPCRVGLYFALSKLDLSHSKWVEACLFMHQEMHTFSGGYERGEQEENLHGQFQGTARIPATNKGADAFKELMKDYLGIVPHSGYKVQCKLLDTTQPDEKMNAYCMKDKPKPWFMYDSKDVNGEAYSEEYNDFCVEKYKVLILFTA